VYRQSSKVHKWLADRARDNPLAGYKPSLRTSTDRSWAVARDASATSTLTEILIAKLIFLSASKADPIRETEQFFSLVRTGLIDAYIFVQVSNKRFLILKTRPRAFFE
jgi:hypothetical protein